MTSRESDWSLALGLQLLLAFLANSLQESSELEKIEMSGSNVSLQIPSEQLGNYTRLTWFYNTQQKIAEWDRLDGTTYYKSPFKQRVMLDSQSPAHLHIYHVRKEDSSTYLLRVSQGSGKEQEWRLPLQVFDPVPEPVIKIERMEKVNGNCHINLSCVFEDESASYVWYQDSGPLPKELQKNVLELILNPKNQSRFYMCQANNPVSSKNDTVYFTPPCSLDRSTAVTLIVRWWIITVPIIVGFLLTSNELF